MNFAYEARDMDGRLNAGMIVADSRDQAGMMLSQRGLFVVRVDADEAGKNEASPRAARATQAQVAWQMSQLAIMLETGITLSDSLQSLMRQATQPGLKSLLRDVSQTVESGKPLSEAMAKHARSFPKSLVAMIRASEASGKMSQVLRVCADYLMQDMQSQSRIKSAFAYPAFMLSLCVAVTAVILTWVLPRFADVFASRGATLPAPTRMLMALSSNLMTHWLWWIVSLGLSLMGVVWLLRSEPGRTAVDTAVIRLPVLSRVFNTMHQSRTFRTMAVLMGSGVPLIDTMRIIPDVVNNRLYRKMWRQVEEQVRQGGLLADPILASGLFPEPVARMIQSGDRAGRLGFVFEQLATFVEEEHERAVTAATKFVEPCLILLMGGIVSFIAVSLLLPLFQAGQVLSR